MTSYLMTNGSGVSNDPRSVPLSSPVQRSIFFDYFDSFSTSRYPWTMEPTFNMTCQSSSVSQPMLGFVDGLDCQLMSPLQSPDSSFFEIEPDKTTYETCYDEFMEFKLAVIQEIFDRGKRMSAISTLDTDVNSRGSSRVSSPSLVSSTPSSSSSDSSACQTPEPESVPDVDIVDNTFADSDPEDDKDGDYLPEISYSLPILRRVCRTMQQPQKSKKPAEPKLKRKAPRALEQSVCKYHKYDTDIICRIRGCQHVSKTRFECFKHRETHFPGRFQCPQPNCRKIFVRSSSLSRHLKRERDNACGIYAGPQARWGVGLVNFELFPPPWLAPGYLDDI